VKVGERDVLSALTFSAHDLAVALGIETDLVTPVPRAAFEARRQDLRAYVGGRLTLAGQDGPCRITAFEVGYERLPAEVVVRLVHGCTAPIDTLALDYLLFFEIDSGHRALGRIVLPDGGEEEFLFDRGLTGLELDVAQPRPQLTRGERFAKVFGLGVEHILTGIDHLLFLLALLIVSARFWPLVKIVTAFTVAHSLTLGLAWYGVLSPPAKLVEVLIALSIAYVAVENILGRGRTHRWLVAGGFGLVHGLGFYAVLSDLGLAGGSAAITLLSFNLGVEAGQLTVVALFYGPLVWWLRRPWYRRSAQVASGLILVIASWWLVERAWLS
jgi:hydrogenase/urease accessory protein HupE